MTANSFALAFTLLITSLLYTKAIQAVSVCNQLGPLKELPFKVINTYPHATQSFTQGLVVENSTVYESTGLRGSSSVRAYGYVSGKLINHYELPAYLFAEGLTLVGDKLIQLTYKAGKGLVYDKKTFAKLSEFTYPSEGWGLTYDGIHLIMSNGSATLFYLDTQQYTLIKKIEVESEGVALKRLNELEYIDGKIFANVWQDDRIAIIDPKTACNTAWLNLNVLRNQFDQNLKVDVLNGIAYIKEKDHLLVTGKWWPKLFEIKLMN